MSTFGNKPFGLNDIKVTNIGGTVQADLPVGQQLVARARFRSGELSGDDGLAAVVSLVDAYEWQLQAGGIDLDALAIITGQAVTTTGTTPNEVDTFTLSKADTMPYFKIYGKSLGDGTDDIHVKFYKCKVTALEGTFQDGQFFVSQCSGIAIDNGTKIVDFVQNETATTLAAS